MAMEQIKWSDKKINDVIHRARMIGMWECGRTPLQISYAVGSTESTVNTWIKRWQREGPFGLLDKQRSGRPRQTTDDEDCLMVAASFSEPLCTSSILHKELGIDKISMDTYRRHIQEAELSKQRPALEYALTQAERYSRLAFARLYVDKDQDFWDRIIWTDEKLFTTDIDGEVQLWRPYDADQISPIHRTSGRISVAFWGWMTAAFPGHLVRVTPRMESREYCELLEMEMMPTLRTVYPYPEVMTIVQDCNYVQNSPMARTWFEKHQSSIERIVLPPKSPDLNPIENLWSLLIQDWDPPSVQHRNEATLAAHLQDAWIRLQKSPECCGHMVASMRDRLQEVINRGGAWTHY